jgi:hypothetical protein
MRVKVLAPYQVVHDGIVYLPGKTADVPEEVAAVWIRAEWVTEEVAPPASDSK